MNNKNIKRLAIARNKSSGFTLIELVMVIVILGILSAVALPRFVNLSKEARIAAMKSLGGAFASASAANMAAKQVGSASAIAVASANVCDINVLGNLLTGGTDSFDANSYSIHQTSNGTGNTSCATGESVTCEISSTADPSAAPAQFVVYCAR